MAKDHKEILSILLIGFMWGVTNPLLRRGTQNVEEKEEEKKQKNEHDSTMNTTTDHTNGTAINNNDSNADNNNAEKETQLSLSDASQIYASDSTNTNNNTNGKNDDQHNNRSTTSSLSSLKSDTKTKLTTTSKSSIQTSIMGFIKGIINTLLMFKNPGVAIPFLLNQSTALLHYILLATSDLTNSAYCNALSMVFAALTAYFLGERLDKPYQAFVGSSFVTIGVVVCMLSVDIEELILKDDLLVGVDPLSSNSSNSDNIHIISAVLGQLRSLLELSSPLASVEL